MKRKWLPTLGELIDRMSIHQLKEIFIAEYKEKFRSEMNDIAHDIDIFIQEKNIKMSGELIRCIIALAQINEHIWYNESWARRGESQNLELLRLTHGLNGIRNRLMNKIMCMTGQSDKLDPKTDCLAAEFKDWEMGILEKDNE